MVLWFIRLMRTFELKKMDVQPHKEIETDFFFEEGKYVHGSFVSWIRSCWLQLCSGSVRRGVPSSLPLSISVTRFVVLFVRVAMWCFGAPSPGDSEQFP